MTFSFDSIRNLFLQKTEPVQPSSTPASGQEIEQSPKIHLPEQTVNMDSSFQPEPQEENEWQEDEAEGRYLLESYLEQRYLPDLYPEDEEPSEKELFDEGETTSGKACGPGYCRAISPASQPEF